MSVFCCVAIELVGDSILTDDYFVFPYIMAAKGSSCHRWFLILKGMLSVWTTVVFILTSTMFLIKLSLERGSLLSTTAPVWTLHASESGATALCRCYIQYYATVIQRYQESGPRTWRRKYAVLPFNSGKPTILLCKHCWLKITPPITPLLHLYPLILKLGCD